MPPCRPGNPQTGRIVQVYRHHQARGGAKHAVPPPRGSVALHFQGKSHRQTRSWLIPFLCCTTPMRVSIALYYIRKQREAQSKTSRGCLPREVFIVCKGKMQAKAGYASSTRSLARRSPLACANFCIRSSTLSRCFSPSGMSRITLPLSIMMRRLP